MIRCFSPEDVPALLRLWNRDAVSMGYAPMDEEAFRRAIPDHPDFSRALTFVLAREGEIQGFVTGCMGETGGGQTGYVTCLVLGKPWDTGDNTRALLTALEDAFRSRGGRWSTVSFFNPMALPWVIPGTGNHLHNNVPGVALDLPLHGRMLDLGYRETSRQLAMYRTLEGCSLPDWVARKEARMAGNGDTVALYDPACHRGLVPMLHSLGNPLWSREIPEAAAAGKELLVALHGDVCAGFAGPIYPERSGRGYFAGLAVAPQFQHRGLGTLLFYRLLAQERASGAEYMSLFTGLENPARAIYEGAGFSGVRTFSVLRKPLGC